MGGSSSWNGGLPIQEGDLHLPAVGVNAQEDRGTCLLHTMVSFQEVLEFEFEFDGEGEGEGSGIEANGTKGRAGREVMVCRYTC